MKRISGEKCSVPGHREFAVYQGSKHRQPRSPKLLSWLTTPFNLLKVEPHYRCHLGLLVSQVPSDLGSFYKVPLNWNALPLLCIWLLKNWAMQQIEIEVTEERKTALESSSANENVSNNRLGDHHPQFLIIYFPLLSLSYSACHLNDRLRSLSFLGGLWGAIESV